MANRLTDIKNQLEATLNDSNQPWTQYLSIVEAKTGVNRLYIFIGTVAFLGIWLVFGFAAQLVCNFVGFMYPAYISIRAIESSNKDDDTKWLTYWVVFALFSVVEYFSDTIVGWFPFYWLVKCIFLMWLMIPTNFNGSIMIYNRIIRPYFLSHHKRIDEVMDTMKASAKSLLDKEK